MWLQRNLTHFWTIWLIKLYVAKKAIKDLSVYKLWLSMKQMKRMFITLLKFYRTNQCRVYTLNHEKMFERRSWERTFLLKPKTPQTKELVPEIKEAWWSKQEMIYQLPLLPKWTPLLSVKLSVTQTGQAVVPHLGKKAIMHGNYSAKYSNTCPRWLVTPTIEPIILEQFKTIFYCFPGLLFFSHSGISTHADILVFFFFTENCRIPGTSDHFTCVGVDLTQYSLSYSTRCK